MHLFLIFVPALFFFPRAHPDGFQEITPKFPASDDQPISEITDALSDGFSMVLSGIFSAKSFLFVVLRGARLNKITRLFP